MRGRLAWIVAWSLGTLLFAPLAVLVVRREERVRSEIRAGDAGASAFGPPGDHGAPFGSGT